MSTELDNDARRLAALIAHLDEADATASDDEILADARAVGIDPKNDAVRLKSVMLSAVKRFQQRALHAAKAGYAMEVEAIQAQTRRIPTTTSERRQLFELVVAKQPQYAEMYTTQHRELKDLTDADIESYLEDLDALGVLKDLTADGNE